MRLSKTTDLTTRGRYLWSFRQSGFRDTDVTGGDGAGETQCSITTLHVASICSNKEKNQMRIVRVPHVGLNMFHSLGKGCVGH